MTDAKRTTCIILAAGKGTRMLSQAVPKVLQPLCGMPLLEYTRRAASHISAEAPVIVIGFGRELVRETYKEHAVTWAVQEEQLGTGHAALVGLEALGDLSGDVLILNGDLPHLTQETLAGLVEHHKKTGADGTILVARKNDPTGYGRIIRDQSGKPVNVIEEKDAAEKTKRIKEINAGVYIYHAGVLDALLRRIQPDNAQHELYLTDAFVYLVRDGGKGETFMLENEQEIEQITTRADIARSSRWIYQANAARHMEGGVTVISPETTFIDNDVQIGRDTVILPFCVIRNGVTIGKHCEIGPFTHLREGTVLKDGAEVGNFTEAKNTVLGSHSKAKHLSYLGDGIIGNKVNIGAGTIFANYDGKTKKKTIVEDNAFVGSGSILVAPVSIGKKATTGAGAVVTKHHDVLPEDVVVGVPAKPLSCGKEKSGSTG